MAEIDMSRCVDAVLVASTRITPEETDEVRELKIVIDDPAFRATAGQSIGVVVAGDKEFGGQPHVRRYSITSVVNRPLEEDVEIAILVRRCFYIDEINGEQYPGIASNFLCDARSGQKLRLVGPYKSPFKIPTSTDANLLMIGTGTGIAPFRTFIQRIYQEGIDWKGQVRLFFGARNGMDLLYMNERNNDLANYYDEETFKAFNALSERPLSDDMDALEQSISAHIDEAWELLNQPNTHVYLAGLEKAAEATDKVMAKKAGSEQAWDDFKKQLQKEGRWSELLYR
ncbi:MAG: oxidoreductase [Gammaproteobacteria bacterium]|nr:oxidoreductase [Gammaproteobacteria bacterium]